MRHFLVSTLTVAIAGTLVSPSWAGDAAAGRRKLVACQACHDVDGRGKIPAAPHIGGQPIEYLAKVIADYRSGERKNEMMTIVARNVPPEDIADIIAWYASLEIEVKLPP